MSHRSLTSTAEALGYRLSRLASAQICVDTQLMLCANLSDREARADINSHELLSKARSPSAYPRATLQWARAQTTFLRTAILVNKL